MDSLTVNNNVTQVSVDSGKTTAVLAEPAIVVTSKVEQGPPGSKGDPGTQGPPGIGEPFVHAQVNAAAAWSITHNMHRVPVVELLDGDGNSVEADLNFVNDDVLVVNFLTAISGRAILV